MSAGGDRSQPPPWGIFATILWLALAFVTSAIVAVGVYAAWRGGVAASASNAFDGTLITIGALASVPVQVAVLAWATRVRGWSPAEYLALTLPRRGELILAVASVIALNILFNAFLYFSGHDIVTPFQTESYRTAKESGWLIGLLLAIVLVAPVGEEIAFRGFLYRGLARPGWEMHAIAIIAFVWALLHIQYDWLGMAQVFALGLLLGWFRWASGSTTLAIVMHVLVNLEAMLETMIKVELFP